MLKDIVISLYALRIVNYESARSRRFLSKIYRFPSAK